MTVSKYFLLGQLFLVIGLVTCIMIDPRGIMINDGISYYGAHLATVPPYLIGLLGCALFGYLTAHKIAKTRETENIRYGLIFFSLFTVGIAVTPYNLNSFIYTLHTSFGSVLFFFQFLLSAWIAFSMKRTILIVVWALEFVAGLISAYYLIVPGGYLFVSQIAFQICFAVEMMIVLQGMEATQRLQAK